MTALSVNLEPAQSIAHGESLLELEVFWLNGPPSQSSDFSLPTVFEHLILVAGWGGLSGAKRDPKLASATLASGHSDAGTGKWTATLRDVDPGVVIAARNAVLFSHAVSAPLARATIRSDLVTPGKALQPTRGHSRLPFDTEIALDQNDLNLCLQFSAAPDHEQKALITRALRSWLYLTSAGAFEENRTSDAKPLAIWNDDPEFHNVLLSVSYEDFGSSERAYEALRNLALCIHQRVLPIESLEIE